jgi:hypothetical protein
VELREGLLDEIKVVFGGFFVGSTHKILEGSFSMFWLPRSGTFDGIIPKIPFTFPSFYEIMEEKSSFNLRGIEKCDKFFSVIVQ